MTSKVYKKVEIVGISEDSFSDATQKAIAKASDSLHNLGWFEVAEQRGRIKDGQIAEYQVTLKVGFRLD